jgi:uncharacterized membrane protein
MVMIVMNQAASQMSNRILDNIIGNKVQKIVLGFYIGTIIYSLFLLTTISEASGGTNIHVLSIYILLSLTVIDIFLFIYFLHYITQSIRYEQLVKRIHKRTRKSLKTITSDSNSGNASKEYPYKEQVRAIRSGYFQGFSLKKLLALTSQHDMVIHFLHTEGTYILENVPFFVVSSSNKTTSGLLKKIFSNIDFYYGQEVDNNPYFGFRHLTEVGVKALSPGINDPGTAVLSLNALSDLLSQRMHCTIPDTLNDKTGITRIVTKELSFTALFEMSILPIWDYGRKDRLIHEAMKSMMYQLKESDKGKEYTHLFNTMLEEVEEELRLLNKRSIQ